MSISNTNSYIQAARNKWSGDQDIDILDIIDNSPDGGAWVTALLWVSDQDLESKPGPTYCVFISELDDTSQQWGPWILDQTFTCNDDDDGRQARRNAHEYARYLRKTFHCSYVAVRSAEAHAPHRRPLSPQALADYDFKDFSASWLGL